MTLPLCVGASEYSGIVIFEFAQPFLRERMAQALYQGVSVAGGMAMALKKKGGNQKVYAIVGDGEIQEGLVWEAAMSAAHYKLDNLCCKTSKGKGVSFMEDQFGWHGKAPSKQDYEAAMKELGVE